jgi:hypothetical protein
MELLADGSAALEGMTSSEAAAMMSTLAASLE